MRHKAKLTARNRAGETPIHVAAARQHAKCAHTVLKVLKPEKQLVLLQARTERLQLTALHLAMSASLESTDTLDELLACELVPLELRDADGNTPLHCGAQSGNEMAVTHLLRRANVPPPPDSEAQLDVDAANNAGATPLHVAAMHGHAAVARCLIAAGAQREVADANGDTPMHVAVRHDRDEVVGALIALKAKASRALNNEQLTPLQLAAHLGHKLCEQLLSS